MSDRSSSESASSSDQKQAEELVRNHQIIHVIEGESAAFASALLRPNSANDRLKEATRRYARMTRR